MTSAVLWRDGAVIQPCKRGRWGGICTKTGVPIAGCDDEDETATLLSLDYVSVQDAEEMSPAWLEDHNDMETSVMMQMLEEELRHSLTRVQLDIYLNCLLGGISYKEYADKKGVS